MKRCLVGLADTLRVGHHTLTERPTGCTVNLVEKGATAGVAFTGEANVTVIGSLGAEVIADTILRAVREATDLPNYPAVRDLPRP